MYLEDIKITMVLDQMRGLSVFLELLSFLNIHLNRSGAHLGMFVENVS